MSYSAKSILKNIRNKNELEKNLADYANVLTTDYNQYAMFAFSMEYFILYESLQDEELDEDVKICVKKVNDIIKRGIAADFDGEEREKCILELNEVRNEVIEKMDTLADYAERLLIYDYVIERIKYKLDDTKEIDMPDDSSITKEIMQYIINVKDNVVVAERIREVLSQLPIRMTRAKFFDLINNSMTLYKGSEISSVESYVYKLRSSATLYTSKGEGKCYADLGKEIERIKNVDYENMTKEECDKLIEEFDKCSEKIEACSENFYSLQTVINQAYAMILTRPYVIQDEISKKDNEVCMEIIKNTCSYFDSDYEILVSEKEVARFSFIEGRQEEYYYNFSKLESELYVIRKEHSELINSMMLSKQYECMNKCEKLLSTSLFMELKDGSEEEECADEEYIKEQCAKLQTEFSELFKKSSKQVKRSVMSNVISKLPVFFESIEEVQNYIANAFELCVDLYEKKASYNVIKDMIEMDSYEEVDVLID